MLNKIVAVFACFGFAASAGAAEVNFDKGTDVNKIVEESVSKDYYPYDNYPHDGYTYNGYTHEGYPYNGYPSPHHVRYTRDCETFSFGAGGYPMNSGVEYLESIEYVQECHYVPDPPPPPKPPPAEGQKDNQPAPPPPQENQNADYDPDEADDPGSAPPPRALTYKVGQRAKLQSGPHKGQVVEIVRAGVPDPVTGEQPLEFALVEED